MLKLFALASGRSGTTWLAEFFRHNVRGCHSTHEPYLQWGNPTLFGRPILWNALTDDARLLPVIQRKADFIQRVRKPVYFESNHAVVKAAHRHIPLLAGSECGFIHLLRNPKRVAKSELMREQAIRHAHLPFVDYAEAGGARHFRWALTGYETIFQHFAGQPLSRYQFYLLQWLEVEKRIEHIITTNGWQGRVFFINVDRQLGDAQTLAAMLKFFGLHQRPKLKLDLRANKTPFVGPTNITDADEAEFQQLYQALPADYKALFYRRLHQLAFEHEKHGA